MGINEVLPGRGAPVTQKAGLDVAGLERLCEERVIKQIDLADREVVGGTPVGVDFAQRVG